MKYDVTQETFGHSDHEQPMVILWLRAIWLYRGDAKRGARAIAKGRKPLSYEREALEDLQGHGVMLRRMCEPLGIDSALVQGVMLGAIASEAGWQHEKY